MSDPRAELIERLAAVGIVPADPDEIVADGRLHRFHVAGDRPGRRNGWAVVFADHAVGGSWRTGDRVTWTAGGRRLAPIEQRIIERQIAEARRARERERSEEAERAAEKARALWTKARPADPRQPHPYLIAKAIPPGIARERGSFLLLPVVDVATGELRGLQYIYADGSKRFSAGMRKQGGCIPAWGRLGEEPRSVLIAEGWATAVSARAFAEAALGQRIEAGIAALDAGNLLLVAKAVRRRLAEAEIVIAADDDRRTPRNPGLTAARKAARAVGAKVLVPVWPADAPPEATDFNDLARLLRRTESRQNAREPAE